MLSINFLKRFILVFFIFALITSCTQKIEFSEHSSGLKYRFIKHDESANKAQLGDILLLKMIYTTDFDSILFNFKDYKGAFRMQLNEATHTGGSIEDAFSLMNIGDSLVCKINAFDFYTKTRKSKLPKGIKPESYLNFYIKLSGIQSMDKFSRERLAKQQSNENEEMELLERYLKKSNITIEPTMSGLYYIDLEEGKGKKAQAGEMVSIHYTGKFIDGKIFDSSLKRNKPLKFKLGVGEVINGMDEGVSKMKEGGKARLIIPSHIAYGKMQSGSIPPYSTLIFEVELLKVGN